MSSKHNDNNQHLIHLGNYEEFFVLYMDNELTDDQMKMVDDFLAVHPDLQAEFEILMNTKLPAEEFTLDKEELFADSMKLNTVSEDLLLYIDNELPADKAKIVELEIAANEDYRLQHEVLLMARLDASETIAYPNKKELYRRTERSIAFKPWMRIAAAAVVIAAMGVIYFNSSSTRVSTDPSTVSAANGQKGTKPAVEKTVPQPGKEEGTEVAIDNRKQEQQTAVPVLAKTKDRQDVQKVKELVPENRNDIASVTDEVKSTSLDKAGPVEDIQTTAYVNVPNKAFINSADVTSSVTNPYNSIETTDENKTAVASNEGKGSVKGFLRKATRMIEKRTGIEATNDDGKLLIGAVALKLK